MSQNSNSEIFQEIVKAARTGDYGLAASKLNTVLQTLQLVISKGNISAERIKKVTYSLETLMAMQKSNNWVAFADIIEFEFIKLWDDILKS